MKTPGTIDRPMTHDPQLRHLPKQKSDKAAVLGALAFSQAEDHCSPQNRNREMQLMPESLARAQMQEGLRGAGSDRRGRRLLSARRLHRRAERATLRARRALATAVMQ